MSEVDEIHQPERDGEAAGQHEQQHAVSDAVEQDGEQRGHFRRCPEKPNRDSGAAR